MNPSLYQEDAEEQLTSILTGFRTYSFASQEQLRQILAAHLLGGYESQIGSLTEREQERIKELEFQYRVLEEAQAPQVRGLCWLPAPAYVQAKRAMEARA